MDKREREALEAKHLAAIRQMEQVRQELEDYRRQYEHHTEDLMAMVADFCRELPERDHYLGQLDDQLQAYRYTFRQRDEELETSLYHERRKLRELGEE